MRRFVPPVAVRGCLLLVTGLGACRAGASKADEQQLAQLDATLQALNQAQATATLDQLDRLGAVLDQNGGSDNDLMQQASALHARTTAELDYLRVLRQRLHAQTAEPGSAAAPLPASAADSLRLRLRAYASYVQQYVPAAAGTLGLDVKEDLDLQRLLGRRLNNQSFGRFYFQHNSGAGSAAMLSRFEQQVLRLEHDALAKQSAQAGPGGLFFDKISAFAVPATQLVQAGEPYRAQLFLAGASPNVKQLTLTVNGAPVTMDARSGSGQVSLRVAADAPAGPAVWQGLLQGTYHGRKVVFPLRVPYHVQAR